MTAKTDDAPRQHELTRRQVAERLGVSVSSVRRMEGGDLHPVQDERGVWRFAEAEVAKLGRIGKQEPTAPPQPDEGEFAARVFKYFAGGYDLRDVVIELQVAPATVRDLYREWTTTLKDGEVQRREAERKAAELREELEWRRSMKSL